MSTIVPEPTDTQDETCTCGCPEAAHIGEIGCPCGLPDEPPCTPAPGIDATVVLAGLLAGHRLTHRRPSLPGPGEAWTCGCGIFRVNDDAVTAHDAHVAGELAAFVGAVVAAEREWFRSALTSDLGDLLDVEWLRENWWVKHVVAAHLDGPSTSTERPTFHGDRPGGDA